MDRKTLQAKGKQMVEDVTDTLEEKGQQAIDRVQNLTQAKAEELTEEAVITAVDRAVDAIQIASDRIREKQLPTQNTALEVDISVGGVLNLKIKADVPTHDQVTPEMEVTPQDG